MRFFNRMNEVEPELFLSTTQFSFWVSTDHGIIFFGLFVQINGFWQNLSSFWKKINENFEVFRS